MKKYLRASYPFALLTALCCIGFFLLFYFTETNPLNLRRPDLGFNILFILLSIYFYRRKNGGVLHFYEGVSVGFLTNIIAALITGLFLYAFIKFIDPKPFQEWIEGSKTFLMNQKDALSNILDDKNFERQLVSLENSKPYQLILDELFFKQLGIIAITLGTMVLRKHNSNG